MKIGIFDGDYGFHIEDRVGAGGAVGAVTAQLEEELGGGLVVVL